MKRIIMLCSMFVLFFALSVPAFATDEYTVSGYWDVDNYGAVINHNFSKSYGTVNGTFYWSTGNTRISNLWCNGNSVYIYYDGNEGIYWDKNINANGNYFYFGDTAQTVSAELYAFLNDVASPRVCDGSTCPATDGNMDNICDDCAKPFAVPREYTLPDPYAVWTDQTTYPYAMVTLGNNLYLLPSLPFYYDIGSYIRHEGGTYERYKIEDGQWVYDYTSSNPVNLGAIEDVQHTSFDLNYEGAILIYRDTDFFPVSLQEVIQEGVSGLAREMGGTMTILVACGVGLIACLAVLKVFGKVLPSSLKN